MNDQENGTKGTVPFVPVIDGDMKETIYTVDIPVSLALLGDLHGKPWQPVVSSLQKNKPEVIAIAGDIIYSQHPADNISPLVSQPNILPFLERCATVCPTFLSLGNHEWMLDDKDLEQIRATGVMLLDNSWAVYNGVVFGGLTPAVVIDYREYRYTHPQSDERYPLPKQEEVDIRLKRKKTPDLDWLSDYRNVPGWHILLNHHPEYYPLIPQDIEMILSCHAHGGQWRFYDPVRRQTRGFYSPGQGFFPRWTKGVYDGRLIVSAGLANATWAPRLFNPTEVVYLRPEE